jgi:copper chaperone CopZ
MKSILPLVIFTIFTVLTLTISTQAADKSAERTSKCRIATDINSFYDKDIIETELKKHEGVLDVYLDLDEKVLYVTYEYPKTDSDKLCKLIRDLGYGARVIEDSNKV